MHVPCFILHIFSHLLIPSLKYFFFNLLQEIAFISAPCNLAFQYQKSFHFRRKWRAEWNKISQKTVRNEENTAARNFKRTYR